MGTNKKDAVLQTTELKNSVFATAGMYPGGPNEGAYVYVSLNPYSFNILTISILIIDTF